MTSLHHLFHTQNNLLFNTFVSLFYWQYCQYTSIRVNIFKVLLTFPNTFPNHLTTQSIGNINTPAKLYWINKNNMISLLPNTSTFTCLFSYLFAYLFRCSIPERHEHSTKLQDFLILTRKSWSIHVRCVSRAIYVYWRERKKISWNNYYITCILAFDINICLFCSRHFHSSQFHRNQSILNIQIVSKRK